MESERAKGETSKPDATLKLIDSLGISRAARKLGVSNTLLHNVRKSGVVSKVVEVASAGLLDNTAPQQAEDPSGPLYLITIPADKEKLTKRLLEALGATIVVV